MGKIDLWDNLKQIAGADDAACKQGCWYCCTTHVDATVPDIIAVAEWVKVDKPQYIKRLRRYLKIKKEGVTRCPFLTKEKTCACYEYRPMTCRAVFSNNWTICRDAHKDRKRGLPLKPNHRVSVITNFIIDPLDYYNEKYGLKRGMFEFQVGVMVIIDRFDELNPDDPLKSAETFLLKEKVPLTEV